MGQSHSKRHKSRRYQFGDQPDQPPDNQRRFTRRQQRQQAPQHQQLARHSQHVQQHQHLQQVPVEDEQLLFRRRHSQDFLQVQLSEANVRTRPQSWHETRFNPVSAIIPDVRSRITGSYNPNVTQSSIRETAASYAQYDNTSVTTTGYYSMDRRETYTTRRDASFAPEQVERSEVTEQEIEQLVEELRDSDWVRLGSHLGVTVTRMESFRDRYQGNAALCATEILLLWKHNSSEVANPRAQLSLALSTIGREDLYSKIKRKTYLNSNVRHHEDIRIDRFQSSWEDDKRSSTKTDRSLEKAESGVETVESLSDSLEDESEDENDRYSNIGSDRIVPLPLVINVPIAISTSHQADKPSELRSVRRDGGELPPPEYETSLDPAGALDDSNADASSEASDEETITSETNVPPITQDTVQDIRAAEALEPAEPQDETVSIAVVKSFDGTVISAPEIPIPARPKKLPDIVKPEMLLEDTKRSDLKEAAHETSMDSDAVPQEVGLQRPTAKKLDSSSSAKVPLQMTEDELHILAGDIRSSSEWRLLGKRLGLTMADMKGLAEANNENVTMCAFGVLRLWKQRNDNPSRERYVLASVVSDLGRDDLYSSVLKNKLGGRLKSMEASLQRWQEILKGSYRNSEFDSTEASHIIDVGLLHKDRHGVESNLLNRHGILKVSRRTERQEVVVLHGDAGCGKTTLLKRLAHDWAQDNRESPLSDVPLVLLHSLQELQTCSSIGEAVVKYHLGKDVLTSARTVDDYLKLYPDRAVLLLDGFDLSHSEGDLRLLEQIRGQTQCRIVVTSRTCPSDNEELAFSWAPIQIQDLNVEHQKLFVQSYFEGDTTRSKGLLDLLKNDDILACLSGRILYLDIICYLWSMNFDLPEVSTISDLLTSSIVLLFQATEIVQSDHYDVVKKGVHKVLSDLSRVALDSILQPTPKLSFKTTDLTSDEEKESAEVAARAGLLQCKHLGEGGPVDEPSHANKEETDWKFSHPLLHEKCAGMHMTFLINEDPERFEQLISSIQFVQKVDCLKYVLMFACNESADVATRILKLLGDLSWGNSDEGSKMRLQDLALKCNFESHRGAALNRELQYNMRSLTVAAFTRNFLTDVTLRYFIKNSIREAENPVQLERVQFAIDTRADMDYATACLQNEYFVSVPEYDFQMPKTFSPSREASRRLSDDVMSPNLRCLHVSSILSSSDFISNLHSSETLEGLVGSDIDPKYIDVPAWCRSYPNLQSLSLTCAMYQDLIQVQDHRKSLQALDPIICTLTKLTSLHLSNFYFSETLVQIATNALQSLPKLSNVQIGPSGDDLDHYSEEIEGACEEVSEATMHAFVKAVKKASTLKTLELSCFGNFERLHQLLRSETNAKGRRGSGIHYSSDTSENGYWVFKR